MLMSVPGRAGGPDLAQMLRCRSADSPVPVDASVDWRSGSIFRMRVRLEEPSICETNALDAMCQSRGGHPWPAQSLPEARSKIRPMPAFKTRAWTMPPIFPALNSASR